MSKKITNVEFLKSLDRNQHITLQDLIDLSNDNNLNPNEVIILSLNVEDSYINTGKSSVIQQKTGDNFELEDYLPLNETVVINGNIYLRK